MTANNHQVKNQDVFDLKKIMDPKEYEPFIGQERVEALKQLAGQSQGKSWTNINSTLSGGGVAEIMNNMVPLARGLGIDTNWYAIKGNDPFFGTTKKFHNMLQGINMPITIEEIFENYLPTVEKAAEGMHIESDLIVVHDPQPLCLVSMGALFGHILWRCHIDTSNPNKSLWRFVLPYINQYAGAIFTMPEFVGPGVQVPQYEISPCIDPRAEKNKQYSREDAMQILGPLFNEFNIDPDRPIIAAISRYDVHKNQETILKSFEKLKKEKKFKKPPILIFMGNTATDDPEGGAMLDKLKEISGENADIKFWVNVNNNDKVVGALMSLAKFFTHISTKEGFGLVVSEALWQSTPVIGSRVGGIKKQVIHQKTGFIVEPNDVDAVAEKMAWLLEHEEEAEQMGKNGKEHVRNNFLITSLVEKYLTLLQYYTKTEPKIPSFRLNKKSYKEIINDIKAGISR